MDEARVVVRAMRFGGFVAVLVATAASSLRAQAVRGTIVDETRRLPIADVQLTLVESGKDIAPGTRSDSLGNFVLYAQRPATYTVRATRIGFRPQTSEPFELGTGQLVVLQLRMTTVAQELVPIRIVERRVLSLTELDSWMGFELRKGKGKGTFLDEKDLAKYQRENVNEMFMSDLRGKFPPGRGGSTIACSIYVDGLRLGGANGATRLDAIGADDLYGIEIYRGGELPPFSTGGSMGGIATSRSCAVGVWTKNGRAIAMSRAPQGAGASGMQVIRGTTVDFDTERPVPGVRLRVYELTGQTVADVKSDQYGEFIIRTRRMGQLSFVASDFGRGDVPARKLNVTAEELVILKVYVSPTKPVEAPLAVVARMHPQDHGIAAVESFVYRRERGFDGVFFNTADLRSKAARNLAEIVARIDGVRLDGRAPSDSVMMRDENNDPCRPAVLVNGARPAAGAADPLRTLIPDSLFGIEVYTEARKVPTVHSDVAGECGMIGIWTQPPRKP